MPAIPQSQEEILDAALAALTEADIPPDDQDYACADPDPDTGPPAEMAAMADTELDELLAGAPARPAPPAWPLSYQTPVPGESLWPAGFEPRDGSGKGSGFADGGVLDVLGAGMTLAGFADEAYTQAEGLDGDRLVGVLRAWRRLTSWAQARELAMIAALARRRPADGYPPAAAGQFPVKLSEFIGAEVGAALTLTGRAAENQLGLALDLATRPATWAALETGQIDLPRARLFTSLLVPLTPAHADAVEAEVLPKAGGLTTGQLRAALERAILVLDPEAARRRREEAERDARVEHYGDPEGTATLAGRNLPPAQALAASKRLTQIAASWKKQGATGGMDLLRAHAYLALLNGLDTTTPPASLLLVPATCPAGEPVPGPDGPDASTSYPDASHPAGGVPGHDGGPCSSGTPGPDGGPGDDGDPALPV